MTITFRSAPTSSGIQQNSVEFLTVDSSNNATLSNNLTVTGTSAFTGQVTATNGAAVGGNLQFNSGYGSAATAYGCRAWVNFNGTGTVAIRASGNVSSITDNGTGDYTVNFTTAMVDANYAVEAAINCNYGSNRTSTFTINTDAAAAESAPTTSSFRGIASAVNAVFDAKYINISVFR